MATHNVIKDDGMRFQIVPNTRKITVPPAYKVIGIVGDHNSEQLTFQCPKNIDGHDVVNCKEHYIIYKNANGISDRVDIPAENITTDEESIYMTWVISSGVTDAPGTVSFAVFFADIDEYGNTIYRWGTTTCSECQVLNAVINDNPLPPVEDISLQEKIVTGNGDVTADLGYDGLSKVTVAIPIAEEASV